LSLPRKIQFHITPAATSQEQFGNDYFLLELNLIKALYFHREEPLKSLQIVDLLFSESS